MPRLRRVVLERLIRYYRHLAELTAKRAVRTITSAQLGATLDVDPSQVRKDFAAVGLTGVSRIGYDVAEVCRTIRSVLGFDETYPAVLIGAGHLGAALLSYHGFERYGLRILAAFDSDPERIGQTEGDHVIRPVRELSAFIADRAVELAILTTPVAASQGITDEVVAAGVRAIWNFSPTRLRVPEGVLVRNEHISVGLSEISFHLHGDADGDAASPPPDGECATEADPEPRDASDR